METTSKRESVLRHPIAVLLWVIVGVGLVYGVSQTALKASTLFTG
jgi:hypothetical protein